MPYSGGLYLDDEVAPHALKRAENDFKGRMNSYMQALVRADMHGTSPAFPYTRDQIDQFEENEMALLNAARIALTIMHGNDPKACLEAAREMAEIVTRAALRRPKATDYVQSESTLSHAAAGAPTKTTAAEIIAGNKRATREKDAKAAEAKKAHAKK